MATGVETHYPDPGDFSVCIQCGSVSVFDANLKRVKPEPAAEMPPEVARVQAAIRQLRS
jgi:hypothetical protein